MRRIALLAALVLLISHGYAEKIYLKSGKIFDCRIVEQNQTYVYLNCDGNRIPISKDVIAKIENEDGEEIMPVQETAAEKKTLYAATPKDTLNRAVAKELSDTIPGMRPEQMQKQDNGVACFRIGIKAGFYNTMLYGKDADNLSEGSRSVAEEKLISFIGGMFLGLQIKRVFCLQGELLFTWRGEAYWISGPGILQRYTYTFYYLDIPLVFKLRIPTETVRPGIFVGPLFSAIVGSNLKDDDEVENRMDNTCSFDLGLVCGGSLDFRTGSIGEVNIECRYSVGFLPVDYHDPLFRERKNMAWGLIFGYAFTTRKM